MLKGREKPYPYGFSGLAKVPPETIAEDLQGLREVMSDKYTRTIGSAMILDFMTRSDSVISGESDENNYGTRLYEALGRAPLKGPIPESCSPPWWFHPEAVIQRLLELSAEEPRKERDRMRESIASSQKKATTLVELRNQRQDDTWKELIYISRYLVAMSLPYEPTKDRQITKSARLGDGRRAHLTLTAGLDGIDLPYGSDRTLLHWLLDQVARQIRESDGPESMNEARFVKWSKASDYLRDMGLDAQGGKNYRDLRARYRRLSGLMIGIRVEGDGMERTSTMSIIEDARLPSSIDLQAEVDGRQLLGLASEDLTFGVLLSNKLVQTLMEAAVPFPKEILRRSRKQSQMQDYWFFLAWRSFAAKKSGTIPWDELREQLWQHDQTARRIKTRFRDAITSLRVIWPELQAEAREEGLRIGPPRGGVQLIGRGGEFKRLSSAVNDTTPDFPARQSM